MQFLIFGIKFSGLDYGKLNGVSNLLLPSQYWKFTDFQNDFFVRRVLFIAQPFPTVQLARECFCGTFAMIFCRPRRIVAHQRPKFAAFELRGVHKRATVQVW